MALVHLKKNMGLYLKLLNFGFGYDCVAIPTQKVYRLLHDKPSFMNLGKIWVHSEFHVLLQILLKVLPIKPTSVIVKVEA